MPFKIDLKTITIYPRWTDPITKQIAPIRRVLHNATFRDEGTSIARNTGINLKESLFSQVFLEDGMEYVEAQEWHKLHESELEGKWTADFSNPTQATVIVGHESNYEFSPGTSAEVTREENEFIASTADAHRIAALPEDNRRGITDITKHILLRG